MTLAKKLFAVEVYDDSEVLIVPLKIRIYDNGGETVDRYTVVFTGKYPGKSGCDFVGFSSDPTSPQGFYQHEWHCKIVDRPSYRHLGKPIGFQDLPLDCQKLIMQDYKTLWQVEKFIESQLQFSVHLLM